MNTPAHSHWLHNLPFVTAAGCALLPFLGVHLAYLLSADYGFVAWCFPYIDSCTSISATGRTPPASFVFRAFMLPSAMLMMLFWWLHWHWLRGVTAAQRQRHSMLALGWLACVGLIMYVTVLGEVGDLWRLQRKIGTILFFSFTFLAQLLLSSLLDQLHPALDQGTRDRCQSTGRRQLRLCQIMLAIGILSVLIQLASEDWHDAVEDAMEWQLALLLQLNFLLSALMWRKSQWHLAFARLEQ